MLPELTGFEYFHFLRPLWALALIPGAWIWMTMNKRRRQGDMFDGIIAPHLLEHLRLSRFDSGWINPQNFTAGLLLLFVLILMGPTWRQQPSPLSQDDSALVIVLDVSASMTQQDVQPSRLQRAKQKIADLLAQRPDKQAALIVYAGSAHTVLSLTSDQAILGQYLAAIEPTIMPLPGKFPEYALVEVDEILRHSESAATLVLIGDGLGSDSSPLFEQYFSQRTHQLLVLGIGTEAVVEGLIPLEKTALKQLASDSSGSYIDLSIDDSDVRTLNRRIESHFVVLPERALPWLDSGYLLVFPAMALFLMWFRKGWTLSWGWVLIPLLLLPVPEHTVAASVENPPAGISTTAPPSSHWFADFWLTPDQQALLLMKRGDYAEAASRFQNLQWKALAYYYAEQFMTAAEYFSRSDTDDALFNEANARAHARDYVRARSRYDRLLARHPDYPGASENRALVQAIIDEINRLSESQQEEAGVSGEDRELDGDEPVPADGGKEEIRFEDAQLTQLTAEDILQDPATSEMWLRGVQQDPSDFLAIKFSMQLQQSSTAQGSPE